MVADAPPAVEVRRLAARYATQPWEAPALADVSIAVRPGERLLLLGPNGAGKSTLVRVLAGLMRPASGEALVGGVPASRARGRVGVVAHSTFLYDELSVVENLRLYGELYGVQAAPARAAELAARVGLQDAADERVGRLSRGQQQRVALARALVHDPPVLLLDEPDTGLDVAAFHLLEEIALGAARTVLLTTHNVHAGLRIGSRVAVLARGRLVHQQDSVTPSDGDAIVSLLQHLSVSRSLS